MSKTKDLKRMRRRSKIARLRNMEVHRWAVQYGKSRLPNRKLWIGIGWPAWADGAKPKRWRSAA